jgi:hypothetical protein
MELSLRPELLNYTFPYLLNFSKTAGGLQYLLVPTPQRSNIHCRKLVSTLSKTHCYINPILSRVYLKPSVKSQQEESKNHDSEMKEISNNQVGASKEEI